MQSTKIQFFLFFHPVEQGERTDSKAIEYAKCQNVLLTNASLSIVQR